TRPNGTKLTAGPPPLRDDIADELGLRYTGDPPDQAA
ncbi:MAG: hypothetical protein V7636_796, partial [Actinomycetota bacterium]